MSALVMYLNVYVQDGPKAQTGFLIYICSTTKVYICKKKPRLSVCYT